MWLTKFHAAVKIHCYEMCLTLSLDIHYFGEVDLKALLKARICYFEL